VISSPRVRGQASKGRKKKSPAEAGLFDTAERSLDPGPLLLTQRPG